MDVTATEVTAMDVAPMDVTATEVTAMDVIAMDVTATEVTAMDVPPMRNKKRREKRREEKDSTDPQASGEIGRARDARRVADASRFSAGEELR